MTAVLAWLSLLLTSTQEVRCERGWWLQVALRSGEWECDLLPSDDLPTPALRRARGRVACAAGMELVRVEMLHETDPQEARCRPIR